MLTITRKDLLLTINDNVIPAMGSSDVPVKFANDKETYVGFLIEPRVGYYINGCPKSTVCEYDISSNTIKIPAEAFKNKGILVIAIALIDNEDSNHIEVTKELALEVTPAPNGTVILPATETWQTAVNNLVEQLYNQEYKPLYDKALEDINEAVQTANTALDNANLASQNVQTAYENLGDYKVENGILYFMKADGTYNEQGITLAGQSTVTDANGNTILTGPLTAPMSLTLNGDFQSWQRGDVFDYRSSSINKNTYMPDMWYVSNGSKNFILSKTSIGAHVEIFGEQSYFQMTQVISGFNVGDTITMIVSILNHGSKFSMQQRIGNNGANNITIDINEGENLFILTYQLQENDINSSGNFVIQPFFGYCGIEYANCTINYIDLFEGNITYKHQKEDKAIASLRCLGECEYVNIYLTCDSSSNATKQYHSYIINKKTNDPTVVILSQGQLTNIENLTALATKDGLLTISFNSQTTAMCRIMDMKMIVTCEPLS